MVDAGAWIMIALDISQIDEQVPAVLSDREPIQTVTICRPCASIAFDLSSLSLSWLVLTRFARGGLPSSGLEGGGLA